MNKDKIINAYTPNIQDIKTIYKKLFPNGYFEFYFTTSFWGIATVRIQSGLIDTSSNCPFGIRDNDPGFERILITFYMKGNQLCAEINQTMGGLCLKEPNNAMLAYKTAKNNLRKATIKVDEKFGKKLEQKLKKHYTKFRTLVDENKTILLNRNKLEEKYV